MRWQPRLINLFDETLFCLRQQDLGFRVLRLLLQNSLDNQKGRFGMVFHEFALCRLDHLSHAYGRAWCLSYCDTRLLWQLARHNSITLLDEVVDLSIDIKSGGVHVVTDLGD